MRCTRASTVFAEWSRRKAEYAARSKWLRIPFYSTVLAMLVGLCGLPAWFGLVLVAIGVTGLLVVGFFLSKHSYWSLKCPHCEKRPFYLYNTRIACDHCRQCGYWLLDMPRLPKTTLKRTSD